MESSQPLDTTLLRETYQAQPLEPHAKYGSGEAYRFGAAIVELYLGHDDVPSLARLRLPDELLMLRHVVEIKPNGDGGVIIECARRGQKSHASVSVSRRGELAHIYTPPPDDMKLSERQIRVGGRDFTQTSIDVAGTPEGVRVQIRGTVTAAPRLVDTRNQRSPLMFFLVEEDPAQPDKAVTHEVWAINKSKQELKALKLVKGNVIEIIGYRHTYDAELENHEKVKFIRHNLVRVIAVEGRSAKRQRREA